MTDIAIFALCAVELLKALQTLPVHCAEGQKHCKLYDIVLCQYVNMSQCNVKTLLPPVLMKTLGKPKNRFGC